MTCLFRANRSGARRFLRRPTGGQVTGSQSSTKASALEKGTDAPAPADTRRPRHGCRHPGSVQQQGLGGAGARRGGCLEKRRYGGEEL